MRRMTALLVALALAATSSMVGRAQGADRDDLVARGIAYFATAQAEDGSFSAPAGPAVTALVAASLLSNGQPVDNPVVAHAVAYVEKHVHPDGGVYAEGSKYKNYETCVAIMCFKAANADGRYDELLKRAAAFIKQEQWDEDEKLTRVDLAYGGAGYGSHSRPDLSNTTFLIDALQAVGTSADDPAMQRALLFVSRCQNLPTKHNETAFADKNPDGGFYYTIAAGGSSQAGPTDNGGLRSYGSMTYAGLKSMIYAGVGKDDERVKAALAWIGKNYALNENPGMGDAGLYYYYHTFAKSLAAVGDAQLVDAGGAAHDWKQELIAALAASQRANGSWANANARWLENDPNLVTGYALLALSYCK